MSWCWGRNCAYAGHLVYSMGAHSKPWLDSMRSAALYVAALRCAVKHVRQLPCHPKGMCMWTPVHALYMALAWVHSEDGPPPQLLCYLHLSRQAELRRSGRAGAAVAVIMHVYQWRAASAG